MIRTISNILFFLSIAALVAAAVVIGLCVTAGRPDLAYPASNMLALAGVGVGVVAICVSSLGRRNPDGRAQGAVSATAPGDHPAGRDGCSGNRHDI